MLLYRLIQLKIDLIGDHLKIYLYLAGELQDSIYYGKKLKVHLHQHRVSLRFKSDGKEKKIITRTRLLVEVYFTFVRGLFLVLVFFIG